MMVSLRAIVIVTVMLKTSVEYVTETELQKAIVTVMETS